mgnify:CR=1 FL=1
MATWFEAQILVNGEWINLRGGSVRGLTTDERKMLRTGRWSTKGGAIERARQHVLRLEQDHGLRSAARVVEVTEREVWLGQLTEDGTPFSPWRVPAPEGAS